MNVEELSKYWKFVRINSAGKVQFETIAAAQTYFQQQFANCSGVVADAAVIRQLWQIISSQESIAAELCLRCYISRLIYWVCFDLGTNFGNDNGFSCEDLLPLVLDDEVLLQFSGNSYESLATRIIKSFDPAKGSLKTWVNRYVKQHPELQRFLLQHGVFIISDWALLNDTNPKELQRIMKMFELASLDVRQSIELLISYHAVYREDRIEQRLKGKTLPCQSPTPEQLTRIANDLQARTNLFLDNQKVLTKLQEIAAKLRQYRIAAKGGFIPTVSINKPEVESVVEDYLAEQTDIDTEQIEFIKLYQKEFIASLDLAIAQVIEDFIDRFQGRRSFNKEAFIQGLHLFHCQGRSMSQIAPEIGLQRQYEVTRLLKLNDLRADIRQKLLRNLREQVMKIAKYFANSERLQSLENQVELILDEQITGIIQEAESEVKNPVRDRPLSNLIARRICCYLDKQKIKGS